MSSTSERRGQCLCGAVKLTARAAEQSIGACHCEQCRHWCGGPFMTIDCGTDVEISGENSVSVYGSSDWAERAFCNQCGSALFYRLKQSGQHIVAAGLFDDVSDLEFTTQVCIDEKPTHYSFAENTKNLTGAELFAMFSE